MTTPCIRMQLKPAGNTTTVQLPQLISAFALLDPQDCRPKLRPEQQDPDGTTTTQTSVDSRPCHHGDDGIA